MVRGNRYTCVCCGLSYKYCPECTVHSLRTYGSQFCCKKHAEIFDILSKHGCNLATAEETLEALKDYDLTGLIGSVADHINSLKPKKKRVKAVKEVQIEESETQE